MEKMVTEKDYRQFDLGAILNITTNRIFTNMNDVCEVLNYLTGDDIFIHQLPRVMQVAQPYVLSIYPELTGVGGDIAINSFEDAKTFVDAQKKIYGNQLPLTPMSKTNGYFYIDPLEEADRIKGR